MSRIFWDSMLFIYLLEKNPQYYKRVTSLYQRCKERNDVLLTSCLVVGGIVAGAAKRDTGKASNIPSAIEDLGFSIIPFDADGVVRFGNLRAVSRVGIADAINLSCAASSGTDLFLTGDKQLMKLNVPGVQFIADFENPIL